MFHENECSFAFSSLNVGLQFLLDSFQFIIIHSKIGLALETVYKGLANFCVTSLVLAMWTPMNKCNSIHISHLR